MHRLSSVSMLRSPPHAVKTRLSARLLDLDPSDPPEVPRVQACVVGGGRPCRLIRILSNDRGDPLRIAQVRAWGPDGTNRASSDNGGVASQTSTRGGARASRAIDGTMGAPVTRTARGTGESWQVSLNPPTPVLAVDVLAAKGGRRLDGASLQLIDHDDDLFFQSTLTGDGGKQVFDVA